MTYKLTGANGDSITFNTGGFYLSPGLTGLGIAPTVVRIDESSRDGGVFRFSRRGIREIDLPVTVLGSTAVDVEAKLRRLARITQDSSGPTELTAVRDAGNLTIDLHYVAGAELEYGGEEGGEQFARLVLSFQAPTPFWRSSTVQSFTLTAGTTGRGLLPKLEKLRVASANKLGVIDVSNTGDVAVFPTYTIRGPVNNFKVSDGAQSWGFNTAVLEGETITVNTEAATVVDDSGANRYAMLLAGPKLFAYPPGDTTVEVTGIGSTGDTFIAVQYATRFEVVHG